MTEAREGCLQFGHYALDLVRRHLLGDGGEMCVKRGGFGRRVSQILLYVPEINSDLQQMRGVGMPEGVDRSILADAGSFESAPEGALERCARNRACSGRHAFRVPPGGWEEPDAVAMRGPEDTQHLERALWQGHVAVLSSLSRADMDKHALTVDVGDLKPQPFGKTQAAGINSGQTDTVLLTCDAVQYAPDFLPCENHRERFGPGLPHKPEARHVTLEYMCI